MLEFIACICILLNHQLTAGDQQWHGRSFPVDPNINNHANKWNGNSNAGNSNANANINNNNKSPLFPSPFGGPPFQEADQQCPCFKKKESGTTGCLEYDLRRQAGQFEEALVYFPELLLDSCQPMTEVRNRNTVDWCRSDPYCSACVNPIMTKLHMKNYLTAEELKQERRRFGFNESAWIDMDASQDCWRLKFYKPSHEKPYGHLKPFERSTFQAASTKPAIKATASPARTITNAAIDTLIQKGSEYYEKQKRVSAQELFRGRRQTQQTTTNQTTTSIGKVYQVDCINRGDTIDANNQWVSLCNICWVWRELPSNYFPRYLNEFVCGNDTKCLSGFGECRQRMRPVDLMQNFGTEAAPNWRPITMGSPAFCECEAIFGSEFHRFVAA